MIHEQTNENQGGIPKSFSLTYITFEPYVEGHASYTHVNEIANALADTGISVTLKHPTLVSKSSAGIIRRLLSQAIVIIEFVMSKKPNAVFARWHFAFYPLVVICKLRNVQYFIEINGKEVDLFIAWPIARKLKWFFQYIMRYQLRHAKHIFCVTEGLRSYVESINDYQRPCSVVPNGANTSLFSPSKISSELPGYNLPPNFVIFFGTMAAWQGITDLLQIAMHPIWPPDLAVVFVGDGQERPKVEAAANRHKHIHYLGKVSYQQIPKIVAKARLSWVCSRNLENRADTGVLPLKMFESLACGVPIVVTKISGQREVVVEGECGILLDDIDDHDRAIQQITDFLSDSDTEKRMKLSARNLVVEKFSWKKRAEEIANVVLRNQ